MILKQAVKSVAGLALLGDDESTERSPQHQESVNVFADGRLSLSLSEAL